MKRVVRILLKTVAICGILYVGICLTLYFYQEKLIFFPEKLDQNYHFEFSAPFEELSIKTGDGKLLNGLLFKSDSSKGLVFYLHGNASSLKNWGNAASNYTPLGYDVFILDYRGYGKSEGNITSEKQFFDDVQTVYDSMKKRYPENRIIIMGYSIGTGPATYLAARNHPRLLVLHAPYYNLTDMMKQRYPGLPTFLLKYKFNTSEFVGQCKAPVAIFHGDADNVIYYGSSLKLRSLFKQGDTLFTLKGADHNNITDHPEYSEALKKVLENNKFGK